MSREIEDGLNPHLGSDGLLRETFGAARRFAGAVVTALGIDGQLADELERGGAR